MIENKDATKYEGGKKKSRVQRRKINKKIEERKIAVFPRHVAWIA